MKLEIQVIGKNGEIKASSVAENSVYLTYKQAYEEGDSLRLTSTVPGYVVVQLEDSIQPSFGWLASAFEMKVPFAEKRVAYSPKSFSGEVHLLSARVATKAEVESRRNLAFNGMDCHENTGLYPHATANVETRGESVFAARNAIDGRIANNDHGPWPYQSWGVNQQADAEIKIEFGRLVTIDEVVITLRADFPHDNWWKQATLRFSDGSRFEPHFVKTGEPQTFAIEPRTVEWMTMGEMKKDETDPSPFPALTQLEAWGINARK